VNPYLLACGLALVGGQEPALSVRWIECHEILGQRMADHEKLSDPCTEQDIAIVARALERGLPVDNQRRELERRRLSFARAPIGLNCAKTKKFLLRS
jgi:hypothetical protein